MGRGVGSRVGLVVGIGVGRVVGFGVGFGVGRLVGFEVGGLVTGDACGCAVVGLFVGD